MDKWYSWAGGIIGVGSVTTLGPHRFDRVVLLRWSRPAGKSVTNTEALGLLVTLCFPP